MFNWFLRIVTVAAAFWASHAYIVAASGSSPSPASFETLMHGVRALWLDAREGFDRIDWIMLSPLAIGFVLVAFLAFGLMRPTGR